MKDIVNIEIPAKPDFILTVRLAVSAIAERAGFDIEDIEDLKVASAEACMLLFAAGPESIKISVVINNGLEIELKATGSGGAVDLGDEAGELSKYLLEALVDRCDFHCRDDVVDGISFYKKLMPED